MVRPLLLWVGMFVFLSSACAYAKVVEHTFHVKTIAIRRLCKLQQINTINGSFPGPTIYAEEGDAMILHVLNMSPYNITIHWHGVIQLMSCWADGPAYITQCPILPGNKYTYKFNITQQEGTLWWHAHAGYQRATIHGALIIYPRKPHRYPFPMPYKEVPIILGEWWNQNVVNLEKQMFESGRGHDLPDANIINGYPGDFYSCSPNIEGRILNVPMEQQNLTLKLPSDTEKTQPGVFLLKVTRQKTYLLRIINAGLNSLLFFKIANHNMTVVAVDAAYTNPYLTDLVVIAPGQTTDVLLTTNQQPGSYYMATRVYRTAQGDRLNNIPATGIIIYDDDESGEEIMQLSGTKSKIDHMHADQIDNSFSKVTSRKPNMADFEDTPVETKSEHGRTYSYSDQISTSHSKSIPIMPEMPGFHDTPTTHKFFGSLTSFVGWRFWSPVPDPVDERLFITVGLGLVHCEETHPCTGPLDQRMAGSLNNISFLPPSRSSILESHYYKNGDGIYTTDFPEKPNREFDYANEDYRLDESLVFTKKATKAKKIKYNSTVEIVFQTTSLVAAENHPMHLHGYNFHVLGQGFGNFDPIRDGKNLNFVNPQIRNTFDVPIKGWAVIRFRANNPGAWYMHCHIEAHLPIGLAVVFIVEDGPTPSTKLPPPPQDLPRC